MKIQDVGSLSAKKFKLTEPYYEKCGYSGGYVVYAPTKKLCGGGLTTTIMSAVKKCKTEKEAKKHVAEHILAISQSNK